MRVVWLKLTTPAKLVLSHWVDSIAMFSNCCYNCLNFIYLVFINDNDLLSYYFKE